MLFLCSYVPSTGIRGEASLKQKKIELSTSEVQPKFNWSSVELQLWRSWIIHMQMSSAFNCWSSVELQLYANMRVERGLNASWKFHMQMSSRSTVEVQLSFKLYANMGVERGLNASWKFHMQMSSRSTVESQLSFNSRSTRVQLAFNCWISVDFQLLLNCVEWWSTYRL